MVLGPVSTKIQRLPRVSNYPLSAVACASMLSSIPLALARRLSRAPPPQLLGGPAAPRLLQPLRWVSPQTVGAGQSQAPCAAATASLCTSLSPASSVFTHHRGAGCLPCRPVAGFWVFWAFWSVPVSAMRSVLTSLWSVPRVVAMVTTMIARPTARAVYCGKVVQPCGHPAVPGC